MSKRKNIMLAYPYEEKRLDKWAKPYIVQPKLDGERCRAEIKDGKANLLSSSDTLINSVPHINDILEILAQVLKLGDIELDGELYCHEMEFDEIHSIVSRQYESTRHEDYLKISYHIFDIVSEESQFDRTIQLAGLSHIIASVDKSHIHVVPYHLVHSHEKVINLLNTYHNDKKYEGIIVREFNAPYVRKRSTLMMKFKPKKVDYYKLIDVKEAISKEGEPKNMAGSVICSDGTNVFPVSAGNLTHNQRIQLWDKKDRFKERNLYVKVGYQNITLKNKVPRSAICIEIVKNNPEKSDL